MLNAAMPYDDSEPCKQYKYQMLRKIEFQLHVLDTVSTPAIYAVKDILETDTTLSPNIDEIIEHQWLTASNTLYAYL
jgi:hypothetical protein